MGIPQIRKRLLEIAAETGNDEIRKLAEATRRRKPLRPRSPPKYQKLTREQALVVHRRYMDGTPMHDLVHMYHTNIGRVSEAIQWAEAYHRAGWSRMLSD